MKVIRITPQCLSIRKTFGHRQSPLIDGLAPNGKLLIVGASFEPMAISLQHIAGNARLAERLRRHHAVQCTTGVPPMIEKYPLEKAAEAYDQINSGRARFRVALTMS